MGSTPGLTSVSSTDSGPIIRCTAMELSLGETVVFIKAITLLIRKKATVFTPGLMAAATRVTGRTASSMVRAYLSRRQELRNRVTGVTVRDPVLKIKLKTTAELKALSINQLQ